MWKFGVVSILTILGVGWCGLTFLVDVGMAWNLARQLLASNYPTTSGTVTRSKVKVEVGSDSDTYDLDVHYRFEVNGKSYESKSIRYDSVSLWKERAEALADRYPAGQRVTVHYNPSAPSDAVLELGPDLGSFYAALCLAPFNAVALAIVGGLFGWLRSRQLGRPITGVSVRSDGLATTVRVYEKSPTVAALLSFGGAGLLSASGVPLFTWVMPFETAIALGWSATLAATLGSWWYARKKYAEVRLDGLRGRLEIRHHDGRTCSLARENVKPVNYTLKLATECDGDRQERFPLQLPYFDPESQESRTLALTEETTEEHAELFAAWLNRLLALPHTSGVQK
jgi:hypothetical protein